MSIPAIAPYPMPAPADLPDNRVTWTPDPARAALLIHDMQRYFVAPFGSGPSPAGQATVNIAALRRRCDELGVPVIMTAQPGGQTPEQRGLLARFWGNGIPGGTDEHQIIDELAPADEDHLVTKWRYNAFHGTDLPGVLGRTGRDQILVTGVYAHLGCLMTACDAFMRDIEPFFVGDAMADFSQAHHEMALRYAAERCATTITTRNLLAALS